MQEHSTKKENAGAQMESLNEVKPETVQNSNTGHVEVFLYVRWEKFKYILVSQDSDIHNTHELLFFLFWVGTTLGAGLSNQTSIPVPESSEIP